MTTSQGHKRVDDPMILVDFGNSFIKWAFAADLETDRRANSQAWERASLAALMDRCWSDIPIPERVIVGSVAGPEANAILRLWVEQRWGRQAEFLIAPASALGVVNAYREPSRLGIDRWAALVAAHHLGAGCNCVVDLGTALTCDVVTADGKHLGGLICPGVRLMRDVLSQTIGIVNTSTEDTAFEKHLGTDTRSCVSGGTLAALAGVIRQALEFSATECGSTPKLTFCGGDAESMLPLFPDTPYAYEPDLVLKGLALLAKLDADSS